MIDLGSLTSLLRAKSNWFPMSISNRSSVEDFLINFKVKLGIWGLLFFSNREKNTQTLADLEITVGEVKAILNDLDVENFSQGPITDVVFGGAQLWVFGKIVKNREVYIKITLGPLGQNVVCISFHVAEYHMKYPFK